ncbi:MAG: CAP domain-containing protein, partial [Coraliomargarita sp.]
MSTWQEGAESGYANIIDGTSDSYSLIQSAKVSLGDNAFRLDVLASLDPVIVEDNWVELDRDVDVQVGTKLFFRDSLQYAYPAQVATVQVSTDDGSTWPHVIYSISGTGEVVEQSFGQREIELGSSFAGQQIRIRFHYEHTGGSLFVGNLVGWFIDDIQVGLAYVPPPKTEWTIGDPSADEVLYVELINRSRANALVEAQRLAALTNSDVLAAYSDHGIDTADIITQYQWHIANGFMANVAQPLAFNTKLLEMSQLHTNDMFDNGFQDHVSVNPASPFAPGYKLGDRINAIGYSGYAGENVFAYARSVEYAHAGFAVDWGEGINNPTYYNQQTGQHEYNPGYNAAFDDQGMQNPAGHRLNIHNPSFNEVGIGVVNGTNGQFGPQLVTQNLGNDPGLTYICGVVYEDINGDSFYSVQNHSNTEGRSDIRIDVDGSFFYTLSTSAGAYAIPVPGDGTYDVTFSGEGIATYT